MPEPTLTKAELDELDRIIADAKTNRGVIQPQAGAGRALAWVAKQAFKAVLNAVANKTISGNPAMAKLTEAEREALSKALEAEINREPTLEELVALRKAAKIEN